MNKLHIKYIAFKLRMKEKQIKQLTDRIDIEMEIAPKTPSWIVLTRMLIKPIIEKKYKLTMEYNILRAEYYNLTNV